MTVLRHPIERVLSSYRMFRNIFLDDPDWTMKAWLLHSPVPPRRHQLNQSEDSEKTIDLPSSMQPTMAPTVPRTLRTDGHEENYMTKWFCGIWSGANSPPVNHECYLRAIENLNHFDFVFLTDSLEIDLPVAGRLLGLNVSKGTEKVRDYLSH